MENKNIEIDSSLFEKAVDNLLDSDEIKRPSVGYWKDAFRRLRKNKLAMVGFFVLLVIILFALLGPFFTPHTINNQDYKNMSASPNSEYWFGTDDMGRDIFARLAYGTKVSLLIGIVAALLDLIFGVIIGGIAGYKGGMVDNILMRFAEVIYSIPYMLLVIILLLVLKPGLLSIIMALSISGWVPMSRLVRGEVLKLKEQEFVQASNSFGASLPWILKKHLIPNMMGPIIVNVTLTVPRAIFSEATLSFIGLGIPAPQSSLGVMTSDALANAMVGKYHELLFPALVISLIMFGFNVFGDGLRDALDPKLRK